MPFVSKSILLGEWLRFFLIFILFFPYYSYASENLLPSTCNLSKTIVSSLSIRGKTVAYERHLGTLTLRDAKGNATACLSYVSYTRSKTSSRPLTFFFNGGPGSSSLFLQLGSFGPLRVVAHSSFSEGSSPYKILDNPSTLLDVSDLVFIDPVGTGFSRPLGEKKNLDFWGVDQDATTSADFVSAYLEENHKWNVPTYLFGESYGTTRIAITSRILAERGVLLNGLIFMSTVLNYGERLPGVDLTAIGYLSSYAAVAWFHHKTNYQELSLNEFLQQVETYAHTTYMQALWQGQSISSALEQSVAEQLSRYTGLSVETLKAHALRPDVNTFRTTLLKEKRLTTGRYDARATASMSTRYPDTTNLDPSNDNVKTPLFFIWNKRIKQDFGYEASRPYVVYDNSTSSAWDWRHKTNDRNRPLETAITYSDLSTTMVMNPAMKIIFLNGFYDLATPFSLTAYDIRHLDLPYPEIQKIGFCRYLSGHMIYFDDNAMKVMSEDLHNFYNGKNSCHYFK